MIYRDFLEIFLRYKESIFDMNSPPSFIILYALLFHISEFHGMVLIGATEYSE